MTQLPPDTDTLSQQNWQNRKIAAKQSQISRGTLDPENRHCPSQPTQPKPNQISLQKPIYRIFVLDRPPPSIKRAPWNPAQQTPRRSKTLQDSTLPNQRQHTHSNRLNPNLDPKPDIWKPYRTEPQPRPVETPWDPTALAAAPPREPRPRLRPPAPARAPPAPSSSLPPTKPLP